MNVHELVSRPRRCKSLKKAWRGRVEVRCGAVSGLMGRVYHSMYRRGTPQSVRAKYEVVLYRRGAREKGWEGAEGGSVGLWETEGGMEDGEE